MSNDDDRIDRGIFKGWREAHVALFMIVLICMVIACVARSCL